MKKKKLLTKIFSKPTAGDITYRELENLFIGLNIRIIEGRGSRIRFIKENRILILHKPHKKELPRYAVDNIRDFLNSLEILNE